MMTLGVAALASPVAAEDRLELWLNPALSAALDDKSFVELEVAQRYREAPADDTHYARLWIGRTIADGVTLSGGAERRREGSGRETRLLQQVGYPLLGRIKGRTRIEQRFIKGAERTAWRLRQRIGITLPLSQRADFWSLVANAEGFLTLRASNDRGDKGLTGLRTFVGVEREYRRIDVSVGYLRQQAIRRDAPDVVGHAPFVGLTFKF